MFNLSLVRQIYIHKYVAAFILRVTCNKHITLRLSVITTTDSLSTSSRNDDD